MTKHPVMYGAAVAAAALLAFGPSSATAQSGINDVVMAGRANGVEVPAATVAWMRSRGPDAFDFEGVWKGRAARIAARRVALEAALSRTQPTGAAASRITASQMQNANAALDGTFRMPLLIGQPTDGVATHTNAAYQTRMFGTGGAYSLTTFYDEMSGGVFNFTGDVIGWVPLPQTGSFYYNGGATGAEIFGRTAAFLQATLAGADPTVNFAVYDNDGPDGVPNSGDDDGYVDLAAFMYPAVGRECGDAHPGIWAHRYTLSGWGVPNYVTNDPSNKADFGNIRVRDYIIQGGLDCDGSLQQIGVVAHEAGHGFGIPDLYDTDPEDGSDGNGIGEWGLMGSGNWNMPESPAHMEAHSKARLGWIDVVTIMRDTAITIEPILESRTAYRLNWGSTREYFLLENRQRLGSEQHLHGTGLLIWHVDSVRYAQRSNSNSVNAEAARKGLDLEEADGDDALDGPNNRGDAGDPWPGSSNRTTWNATTAPNSNSYTAGPTAIAITEIVETASGDITAFIDIPPMITFGDVDDDGTVTVTDLDVVMAWSIDATGPDFTRIMRADVDANGKVDARDALIIHTYLEGLATTGFRVGELGFD